MVTKEKDHFRLWSQMKQWLSRLGNYQSLLKILLEQLNFWVEFGCRNAHRLDDQSQTIKIKGPKRDLLKRGIGGPLTASRAADLSPDVSPT